MKSALQKSSRGLAQLRRLGHPLAIYDFLYDIDPCRFPLTRFPHLVNIEVTNDCNLSCTHCHRNVMNRDIGYMKPGIFEKVVSEAAGYPRRTIKLSGLGEPALHPQLGDMLDFLARYRLITFLYTNGLFIQRFPLQRIIDWNLDTIVVSVDGIDSATYARCRVGGDYQRLRADVQRLHEALNNSPASRTGIEIRHVISARESAHQLAGFQSDWSSISDRIRFNRYIPSIGEEYNGAFKRCRDIKLQIYIRWNGSVPLCGYQYLYEDRCRYLGNVQQERLCDLWHDSELQTLRRHHARRDSSSVDFCRRCSLTQQRRQAAMVWTQSDP